MLCATEAGRASAHLDGRPPCQRARVVQPASTRPGIDLTGRSHPRGRTSSPEEAFCERRGCSLAVVAMKVVHGEPTDGWLSSEGGMRSMPKARSPTTWISTSSPSYNVSALTTDAGRRMARVLPHFETRMAPPLLCIRTVHLTRRESEGPAYPASHQWLGLTANPRSPRPELLPPRHAGWWHTASM